MTALTLVPASSEMGHSAAASVVSSCFRVKKLLAVTETGMKFLGIRSRDGNYRVLDSPWPARNLSPVTASTHLPEMYAQQPQQQQTHMRSPQPLQQQQQGVKVSRLSELLDAVRGEVDAVTTHYKAQRDELEHKRTSLPHTRRCT